jgi:hypothetical protein
MGLGYMMSVEPVNICWSYLFSREWCHSEEEELGAIILLSALIPITPFAYLCVAPFVALLAGVRGGIR